MSPAFRHHDAAESLHLQPRRLGADDRRRAAIGEQQEAQQLLERRGVLQVQRAELEADDQHPRLRLAAHRVPGDLQRVDRGLAAHEADHGALHAARQVVALHQVAVEAGCDEAGAGGDDQVRDARRFLRQAEPGEGGVGQRRRLGLVAGHAGAGGGEGPAGSVEAADRARALRLGGFQHGVAAADVAAHRHAFEGGAAALAIRLAGGEGAEGAMHLVPWHGGGDAVDEDVGGAEDHPGSVGWSGAVGSPAPVTRATGETVTFCLRQALPFR
jgi:hypothetical protein